MYGSTPERLLGTQFLSALGGAFLALWLAALIGANAALILLLAIGAAVLGWMIPMFKPR